MKPLVCKTPQVKAWLDGATQFRMPIVPQPYLENADTPIGSSEQWYEFHWDKDDNVNCIDDLMQFAPYQPGDVLYVKETFAIDYEHGENTRGETPPAVYYKATDENKTPWTKPKWRSSIHMPREYARILLLVKGVRVERVKSTDTGEMGFCYPNITTSYDMYPVMLSTLRERFAAWWNSLYPKYPYDSNPYTRVYDVERIEK